MRLVCVLGAVALGVGCHREDPWPPVSVTLEEIRFSHPMLEAMTRRMVSHAEGQGLVGTGWVREGFYVSQSWCPARVVREDCDKVTKIADVHEGDVFVHVSGEIDDPDLMAAPDVVMLQVVSWARPQASPWLVNVDLNIVATDRNSYWPYLWVRFFRPPYDLGQVSLPAGLPFVIPLTMGSDARATVPTSAPMSGLSSASSEPLFELRRYLASPASFRDTVSERLASASEVAKGLVSKGNLQVHQTRLVTGPPEGWLYYDAPGPRPAHPESLPGYELEFEESFRARRALLTADHAGLYQALVWAVPANLPDPP